jgi:hypothetical protein
LLGCIVTKGNPGHKLIPRKSGVPFIICLKKGGLILKKSDLLAEAVLECLHTALSQPIRLGVTSGGDASVNEGIGQKVREVTFKLCTIIGDDLGASAEPSKDAVEKGIGSLL